MSNNVYKLIANVSANSTIIVVAEIAGGATSALPMDTAGTLRVSGWYLKA